MFCYFRQLLNDFNYEKQNQAKIMEQTQLQTMNYVKQLTEKLEDQNETISNLVYTIQDQNKTIYEQAKAINTNFNEKLQNGRYSISVVLNLFNFADR